MEYRVQNFDPKGLVMKLLLTPILLCAMASSAVSQAPAAPPAQRHRIAVLDFGDGSVMDATAAVFGTRQNIGKGISDMLVDKLTNDGTYRVIERNAISKVLSEQNFSNSSAVDPATAAKMGKVLGVDAIITGDITTFGRDDKHMGLGGGGAGIAGAAIGGFGHTKSKAVVAITARMIDASTGEVLASVTSRGESARSGFSFGGGGVGSGGGGGGGAGVGSSGFGQTIIGEATQASIADLAAKLEAGSTKMPTAEAQPIEGMVADVAGTDIIINVGKTAGVQVGSQLTVMHPVRTVKDPTTGKVLRTIENAVGTLTITSADASSAVGTFHGGTPPKVGDSVRSPK
jgi:curli biogenesis system outer membrane secretion channel CsgG